MLGSDLLPGILRDMNRNFPGLKFSIIVDNTQEILARMRDGDVDIALGYNFPVSPDLETLASLHRRSHVITALDHPMARLRDIRLSDLEGEKFIFPDQTIALRQLLDDAFMREGVQVNEVMSTNSFTLLRQMVESGMGVSIVIGRFLQIRRETIAFVELREQPFETKPMALCRMAGRTPTASSVAFTAAIRTLFAQYGG